MVACGFGLRQPFAILPDFTEKQPGRPHVGKFPQPVAATSTRQIASIGSPDANWRKAARPHAV